MFNYTITFSWDLEENLCQDLKPHISYSTSLYSWTFSWKRRLSPPLCLSLSEVQHVYTQKHRAHTILSSYCFNLKQTAQVWESGSTGKTLQRMWHLSEYLDKAHFPSPLLQSRLVSPTVDIICAAQYLFKSQSQPSEMTCSFSSSSHSSPHLYTLNENTYILIGLRREFYEMSIIVLYRGIHSSALDVQTTLTWICHLRHLGMFLMGCCQVARKNPGCLFLVLFYHSKWTNGHFCLIYKAERQG